MSEEEKIPWVKVPSVVIQSTGITPTELKVFQTILSHRNRKTGACYPSISTISKESRLHRDTVKRARLRLQDVELLTWENKDKGRKATSHYKFPHLTFDERDKVLERHRPKWKLLEKNGITDAPKKQKKRSLLEEWIAEDDQEKGAPMHPLNLDNPNNGFTHDPFNKIKGSPMTPINHLKGSPMTPGMGSPMTPEPEEVKEKKK